MMEFNFTLKYRLPDAYDDGGMLEQRLVETGCDDALLGIGRPGRMALAFCREADNAGAALASALGDVQRALIWHLADILDWLQARGSGKVTWEMAELATAALQLNLAREGRRLQPKV
jgi:hypothetical protein